MDVGGAPGLVSRVSYTGDLGYEIWVAPAYQRAVYHAIKAAGAEFGIVDFGMRALLSMRLEKNFPTWFARAPADLRAVRRRAWTASSRMEKSDFIGRAAAAARARARARNCAASRFIVDADDADVMGDEPIWAKVDRGLRRASSRRTASARRASTRPARTRSKAAERRSAVRGIVDGDWRVVGWVTSGGYAHSVRQVDGAGLRAGGAGRGRERRACSRSRSSAVGRPPASVGAAVRPGGERMRGLTVRLTGQRDAQGSFRPRAARSCRSTRPSAALARRRRGRRPLRSTSMRSAMARRPRPNGVQPASPRPILPAMRGLPAGPDPRRA